MALCYNFIHYMSSELIPAYDRFKPFLNKIREGNDVRDRPLYFSGGGGWVNTKKIIPKFLQSYMERQRNILQTIVKV